MSSCAGGCSGIWNRGLMRKMDVKKLFQDFQNCGVCRRWKREVPGQADVSCLLNYYSTSHQKQSFHWWRAHSTLAACNGLVLTRRIRSRAGDTQLHQLLVQDTRDGSQLCCLLLMLHRGMNAFFGSKSSCLVVASCSSPFQYGFDWTNSLFLGASLGQTQVLPIYSLLLVAINY